MMNNRSSARAQGQAIDVVFLSQIQRHDEDLAFRIRYGSANGKTADFFGRGKISLQQGWRQAAHGDIVESVADFVFRQER